MKDAMSTPDAGDRPDRPGQRYECGTLTYTKAALAALFAWLLWGDFCLRLMEAVVPSVLPLKLKALGCPNWVMGVILSAIPGVLNMTICPWVSFRSDRTRSRWGRRIPFIAGTLPFLCIFLCMLGWSEDISALLLRHVPALRGVAPATVAIALIALFMALFEFFNMFVNSVFWYLFNDVVPRPFIGRFIGMLRIVSTLAGMVYNYFIFRYAESHMREILLGAALLYFVGFGLMCWRVKEGEYPPLEADVARQSKGLAGIRTFLRECFTHRFYWLIFLATGCVAAGSAIGPFNVFFSREMGLSLEQIGKLQAVQGGAALVAMYFTAVFVDRWHPMRISAYLSVFGFVAGWMSWVWIFVSLPGTLFFWFSLAAGLIATFQSTLTAASSFPREMRLFPQSRFGQFCSAQAMFRSFCTIIAGLLAGAFIDTVRHFCHGSDFAYRFNFIWSMVFTTGAMILTLMVYRRWHRMGGDAHFHPPAPWSPSGVEELPVTVTVGPQTRWLNLAIYVIDALMFLSALGIPLMMAWMRHQQAFLAHRWFGSTLLPLALLTCVLWVVLRGRIRRDMALARRGEQPRSGIPHHGMILVAGTKFLLALILWAVQVVMMVNRGMQMEAIVFGIANVATNIMLVGAIHLMCRVEQGYSTTIDVRPVKA